MALIRLLFVASVLLVPPPCMMLVVSISLFGINPSLVWLYIIISTWCGRLNLCLCSPFCVDGLHIYVLTSILLKPAQTRFKNRSNTFNSLFVLWKPSKNAFNGLSVLGKFLQTCVFLFLVLLMTPFVRTHAIEVLPVSCSPDDSILSQYVVLPRNESVRFETYLL